MNIHDKSRYHEVHARSMADPEGFWAEAAREIDWIEPAKKIFDPHRRLRPLVCRRRGQHLLQRARPPCRGRPRRPGGADPRFAADGSVTKFTYAEMLQR
jgi:propionyl-CoA synthetase